MRRTLTATGRHDRLRIGPWRGDPAVALISPLPGSTPSPMAVARAVVEVTGLGYRSILTPALSWPEQDVFLQQGFGVHERLHLLGHDLRHRPEPRAEGVRLRRAHRTDVRAVLVLDGLAFDSFWRFDRAGLDDARRATPRARFTVAEIGDRIVGYHVTGMAGRLGYLQRLAVHPEFHRHGIGTAMVGDALDWCTRRHGTSVLVNTQETNLGALRLYHRLGFVDEPTGLAVLELDLTKAPR